MLHFREKLALLSVVAFLCPTVAFADLILSSNTASGGGGHGKTYSANQVIGHSEEGTIDALGLWFINTNRSSSDKNTVFRLAFSDFLYQDNPNGLDFDASKPFSGSTPKIIGPALVYPNPFSMRRGAELGYVLSTNMEIHLEVYDMFGHRILRQTYSEGTNGAQEGINKLTLNSSTFSDTALSTGVYLFVLVYQNKLLAKGKFAVVP